MPPTSAMSSRMPATPPRRREISPPNCAALRRPGPMPSRSARSPQATAWMPPRDRKDAARDREQAAKERLRSLVDREALAREARSPRPDG